MLSHSEEMEKSTGVGDFVLPQDKLYDFGQALHFPWWGFSFIVILIFILMMVVMKNNYHSEIGMCQAFGLYYLILFNKTTLWDWAIVPTLQMNKLWPKDNNSTWLRSCN